MKNAKTILDFQLGLMALIRFIEDCQLGKCFSICLTPDCNFIVKITSTRFLPNIVDNDEVYTQCEDIYAFVPLRNMSIRDTRLKFGKS